MAAIDVHLTEQDVHKACRAWAVTRVLNEGKAINSEIRVTVCNGKPNGTITSVVVSVETDRMKKGPPDFVGDVEVSE